MNMHDFVIKAMAAVWDAYDVYYHKKDISPDQDSVRSWLYDAASLLDILAHDERMLAIYDDYYKNSKKLPWNHMNEYPAEQEPSYTEVEKMFDIWSDFADEESPPEVTTIIESKGLGSVDAVSFMAFCNAWQKAMRSQSDHRTMEIEHEKVCG
jgi:hypothetical protein